MKKRLSDKHLEMNLEIIFILLKKRWNMILIVYSIKINYFLKSYEKLNVNQYF